MSEAKLFSPLKVGAVTVPNRVGSSLVVVAEGMIMVCFIT
ncbi:N-ethylmaleimide reductase [Klebsiella pneumoniae]|nr:N-ethylmaleimide reductase [Klebsiella pneumoniae]STS66682.1 N-ethylmaleimide reductase [Klebsiella pneumoniae]STS70694.1 N-ethylmaleimide reductase [Klebsiella pneumoniae]